MSVVSGRVQTWGEDIEVKDTDINRWMDDDILLSTQLAGLMKQTHYPHVATSDNKLSYIAAADQVSLVGGQVFMVAGVLFNTADLESLVFAVADDSTRFLRVRLPEGFGLVEDETADPIERADQPEIYWAEGEETDSDGTGGGPSSQTDMRILKAVKGSAGETPTITAYANDGHSHVVADLSDYYTQAQVDALLAEKAGIVFGTSGVTLVSGGLPGTTWTTITDSALPDGAKAIMLYVDVRGVVGENFAYFRKPGTTAEHVAGGLSTQVGYGEKGLVIVPVNDLKQVEYSTNGANVAVTATRVAYIV